MSSLILRTATHFLVPLMLLFSVFLLLRGHNEPGGGFSGGLVAAGAFALHLISYRVSETRKALRLDPQSVVGIGLLLATTSGITSLFVGGPFLTSVWWGTVHLSADFQISIGTPLFFDAGVYLVVLGSTLMILFELVEESQ